MENAETRIGIWVEGVDHLGVVYEGIWRVVKRLMLASEPFGVDFVFSAHARFGTELEQFVSALPKSIGQRTTLDLVGVPQDKFKVDEATEQARYADRLKVDWWLVPNPVWSAARFLSPPKLVWFHDFLISEFPQSYAGSLRDGFVQAVESLQAAGVLFVCSSPYVREHHAVRECGVPREQTTVINTSPIVVETAIGDKLGDRESCAKLVRKELASSLGKWQSPLQHELFFHHITNYPYEASPFFFVSSQNRPHKGFLRLAQSLEQMIRKNYDGISLFTTAIVDVRGTSALENFLREKLIVGDFLSVGKLTDSAHAAMISLADIVLHPSTFEGNFPLPFSEAASLGTPCLVPFSRAYADFLKPEMAPWVYYSPTPGGLAAKVKDVRRKRVDYLDAQSDILAHLKQTDLSQYFSQHLHAGKIPQNHRFRGSRKSVVRAQIWSDFRFQTSNEDNDAAAVMHWAGYVDDNAVSVWTVILVHYVPERILSEHKLTLELGSWIDDEYEQHTRELLDTSDWAHLPLGLKGGLLPLGLGIDFVAKEVFFSWKTIAVRAVLNVPELRLSGLVLANKELQHGIVVRLDGIDVRTLI